MGSNESPQRVGASARPGGPAAATTIADSTDSAQLQLALADRHAGQEANLAAGTSIHRDDRGRVEEAVAHLARGGESFTADDVHRMVLQSDPAPYNRNLASSVIGTWARDGRIVEDRSLAPVASANRSRRASRNRWWTGNLTEPSLSPPGILRESSRDSREGVANRSDSDRTSDRTPIGVRSDRGAG